MRKNIFTKATMRRAAAFGLAGCMAAALLKAPIPVRTRFLV